ncbi:MAG: AAC(3) family N-acetyltransferase [Candidatus Izemoplasmatales bacterium]|jgi:aminoglycoside 3-N-acetyltransferase|nr:AAC(3) family N-acetyltransferase [Candidatus Izemoplasmatales bacterium]
MSEKQVIKDTIEPITKQRIIYDLQMNGISEKDTLLLHSSLSSMGFVIGKEMTVINAFLEALIDGALVMPSQTGDNSDPSMWVNPPVPDDWIPIIIEHTPSFDKQTFSTRGMGRIVECFRNYKGVKRSNHPTSSFIAKGKNAKYITSKHKLTPAFGFDSPLGKLYDLNAKVLLMGVSYDNATAFHLAEVLSETCKPEKQGTKMDEKWVSFQDYSYDSSDFNSLGKALETANLVKKFKVGQADSILFDIKVVTDFATGWFIQNRKKDENTETE